jgi:hypothetical protein
MNWILIPAILLGAMILAVLLVNGWMNRRRRELAEAGARIGLTHLAKGNKLIIPLVPLIGQANRKYHTILVGNFGGYDGAFFDLFVSTGKQWNLQSAILLEDLEAAMPMFQIRTPRWYMPYQRVRGTPVDVPGRGNAMHGLKLTSSNPDWARESFSRISVEFLEKIRGGKWTIEGLGHSVVVYRWGTRIAPRLLESYVRQATALGSEMLVLCRATCDSWK